jgi:hypothetical protein
MTTRDEIEALLRKDEEIRLGTVKRNINAVQTDATFLNDHLKIWEEVLGEFQHLIPQISVESLAQTDLSPELIRLAQSYNHLLRSLRDIRGTVVSPNIHAIVLETQKGINDTLKDVCFILDCVIPGKLPNARPDVILKSAVSPLPGHKSKIGQIKRRIRLAESSQRSSVSPRRVGVLGSLERFVLNQKTQVWLWVIAVLALIVFQFTDSELENTLFGYRNWAKLIVLLTTLWFPLLFIAPRTKNGHNIAIYSVIWASLCSIWGYGLLQGLLISAILLLVPISRLLNRSDLNSPVRFQSQFVRPVTFFLFIVGLVITREFFWLVGLTIWLTFLVFLRSTSYKFFRQNYDLIEDLFPDPKSREQRSVFFVSALILSSLLLTTGLIGRLEPNFVVDIYSNIAGFALALVTILLAVQAIIPGINVWSKETAIDQRIREMRFMIRANRGLGGFMSSFFYLLVLSVVGWLGTQRLGMGFPFALDLSYERNFSQIGSIVDVINPFAPRFTYSPEETLLSLSTLLFVVCVCLAIYSVFQLYYLFSTASIFLLPVKDALFSTPVHIERINVTLISHVEKKDSIETFIRDLFSSERKLNGYVINEINVINDLNDNDRIRITTILEMDFIELDEMLRLSQDTFKALFDSHKVKKIPVPIQQVGFAVFRDTHDRGRHNVFSLQIDRDEWEFLKKDLPGFTLEYKVKHVLGAKIVDYMLPDAQIF